MGVQLFISISTFFNLSLLKLSSKAIAHSERRLLTGLAMAGFMDWKLIVSNAIVNVKAADNAKTHQLILVRKAKLCSHLFITYHAIGKAITEAMITSFIKSVESMVTTLLTEAPNTFLIPISFMRRSPVYMASPNTPKKATMSDRPVNTENTR